MVLCEIQKKQKYVLHNGKHYEKEEYERAKILGTLDESVPVRKEKKSAYVKHNGQFYEREEYERQKILGTLPGEKKKKIGNKKYSYLLPKSQIQ